jgi:CBS domain-containing protein
MKVQDAMMRTPAYCSPETNLGSAIEMLWERNCGILPIVDAQEKVIGVVTDRDLCVALGTRNRLAGQITVGEVATGEVHSCRGNDDIHTALQTMFFTRSPPDGVIGPSFQMRTSSKRCGRSTAL